MNTIIQLAQSTGLAAITGGQLLMIGVCLVLLYLAVVKKFEPLLLVPIAVGGILSNAPGALMNEEGGFLYTIYELGITDGFFPLLIFVGVGALTDFSPVLARPSIMILGAAAQFGIFGTFVGAWALGAFAGFDIGLKEAGAIAIIGGADGPTSIYVASKLAPELLGSIAVAAYSYMALVPVIQPPIIYALTTKEERVLTMPQLRPVGRTERILFPIVLMLLTIAVLPAAVPLVGAFCLGNLIRESGVVARLHQVASGALLDTVTLLLGLGVGSKLAADQFIDARTLAILVLGLLAFSVGTASGVLMAKLMNKLSSENVNPIIGAAGVSAVPMAARVAHSVAAKENPNNFLLNHAMGPNVAGVLGSAVAAGVLLTFLAS